MRIPGAVLYITLAYCSVTSLNGGTIPVTNTNDNLAGSLRQAISDANPGDTIVFNIPTSDPNYSSFTREWNIILSTAELTIAKDLTIDAGGQRIAIRRNAAQNTPQMRIFNVTSGTVRITGLSVTQGFLMTGQEGGGGIQNAGDLTLTDCAVHSNTGTFSGGGIRNTGGLTLINCTIASNRTDGPGGGIRNEGGSLICRSSTIADNGKNGVLGGGISTSGTARVGNSIIANNVGSGFAPDVHGTFTSEGFNFVGAVDGSSGFGASGSRDQTGTNLNRADPKIGPLQFIEGPTATMLPAPGSPCIDTGSATLSTDQRGIPRPVDDPAVANAADGSDIGAAEAVDLLVRTKGDSGVGSLRNVIAQASPGHRIAFAADVRGSIELTTAELVIGKNLTILGPGANLLSVQRSAASGTPAFRIFSIAGSLNVAISGLTIANGSVPGIGNNGGGLLIGNSSVALTNVHIVGNSAGSLGGGISNVGTLTLASSTVSGNSAGAGGGIAGNGTHNILTSTISGNSVTANGGGIAGGTVNLNHSTVTANTASGGGGGIFNNGFNGTTVRARNTIIALNTAAEGPDLSGALISDGFNLIGDAAGTTIAPTQGSDQIGVSAAALNLGPLQNNGGPTPTHALLSGSVAVDRGNSASVITDQRGSPRPLDLPEVANAAGSNGSDIGAFEAQPPPPPPPPSPTPPPNRFANISTRLRVETGDNVLIGGFIVTGSMQKRIIVRALGPSLPPEVGPLANPLLELYDANAQLIASNDNWQEAPNRQEIIDSSIPPSNDLESAILRNVDLGAYTAVVRDVADGEGVGLVEVYDLGNNQDSRLANISTRGRVQTGDNVMIGGLIATGSHAQKVILRAIGPSLGIAGQLENPLLELFDANGNPIASNDNWKDTQQSEIEETTIPPSNDLESAIVTFLPPAAYTAVVRGVDDTIGVALVEVYALQ